ncbi:MAG: 2Fe-2S iron-sulfur cluster binding domain-containing protein [Clostridia bacterium]|nr:2Fe-2S iron-sulfur cluster binding domain-containing protein [Clostridia bacterium]
MIVECPANMRLQDYLLSRNIHILTACGGRGNCGKCAVRILKGKTAINTMDRVWFSEAQLEEGWRLGCQVYAQEPIEVELAPRG